MNTCPYVDPSKPSQEIWEEFSQSFTPAVREVVEFAKRIPGFRDLPEHDQVSLLKAGTFEVRNQTSSVFLLVFEAPQGRVLGSCLENKRKPRLNFEITLMQINIVQLYLRKQKKQTI